jgi:hypothetical protein
VTFYEATGFGRIGADHELPGGWIPFRYTFETV